MSENYLKCFNCSSKTTINETLCHKCYIYYLHRGPRVLLLEKLLYCKPKDFLQLRNKVRKEIEELDAQR